MAEKSTIEWTDATWNPVTGCTKISAGCDNCYAERFAERFRGVPGHPFELGFDLTLRPERLTQPLAWTKPRIIFVNSMSDLFHKEVPRDHIAKVFDTMERAHWHIYQVLTKRSTLLKKFLNERYNTSRSAAAHLVRCFHRGPAGDEPRSPIYGRHCRVRFLSIEPLIATDWQARSRGHRLGHRRRRERPAGRPMDPRWAIDIRNQCLSAKVAFFFKQWGGRSPKSGGRLLEGKEWNQFPATRQRGAGRLEMRASA